MTDLWIRAAKDLKSTIGRPNEILEGLQQQQLLKDILEQIEKQSQCCLERRWKIKGFNGRELIVRDLCAKIVNWVNRFAKVGDVATSWDPGHAALPWAAVRFVLLLCANDVEAFETMLEGLEKVSSIIYRGSVAEKVYLSPNEGTEDQKVLEDAIIKLYTGVLEYLMTAKTYFETNSGKRLLYSALRPSGIKHMMRRIADQETNVEQFARLLDAQRQREVTSRVPSLQSSLGTLSRNVDSLVSGNADWQRLLISSFGRTVIQVDALLADLQSDKKVTILKWLSALPYHLHHKSFTKDLIPGSGEWFLSHAKFIDFWSSSSSDIFWLRGFSGCGKTRLTATVIETVKQNRGGILDPAPVAYFYCSSDPAEPERAEPCQILRALVKQLSQSTTDGSIFAMTMNAFHQKEAEAAEHGLGPAALTIEECANLLYELSLATPMTIIIDAVDECNSTGRTHLLRILRDLTVNSTNVVKIFLTSRVEHDIATALNQSISLTVVAEYNSVDITNFVKIRLREAIQEDRLLPGIDHSKFEQKVIESLTADSQGMFQWANLQIAALCDRRKIKVVEDVMEALKHSPKTLTKSYAVLYEQVNNLERNGRMIASKVFSWLLCAQRMLSVEEFLAILVNDRDFAGSTWIQDLTIVAVVDCCCTMVIVDEQLNVLRFAHPSIREFLEPLNEFDPGKTHLCVARRCLDSYLLEPDRGCKDKLSSYSSVYWALHYERTSHKNALEEQLLEFLYEREHFYDSLDDMRESLIVFDETSSLYKKLQATISDPVTPLFAISCFGLEEALRDSHLVGQNLDQTNANGASSLYLAARWGHIGVVCYLLDHGADIDAAGGMFDSAIQAASFAGHIEIVKVLVSRGASAFRPSEFPNSIHAALAGGHERIATFLLDAFYKSDKTVDLAAVLQFAMFDGNLRIVKSLMRLEHELETPLQLALSQGKQRESKRLLEETPDINVEGGLFGNALQAAVYGRSLPLVRIILEKGARVDLRGRFGTALRLASINGHADMVYHLLENGADCNARDHALGDCLQVAAAKGRTEIVEILLEKGASLCGYHGFFGNALQAASFYGHVTAAKLLLKAGALIDYHGRFSDALHAAVHGNQPEMIQFLLANGARATTSFWHTSPLCSVSPPKPLPNLKMYFSPGYTSMSLGHMQTAAMNGNLSVVQTLLSSNILIEYGERDERFSGEKISALQMAALKGFDKIVILLLDRGANVNAVGTTLGSALHAAVASSNYSVAKLLLARGANINIRWRKFGTPLHVACRRGNLDAIRFLCENGANVNDLGGTWGTPTPLQLAARISQFDIVRLPIVEESDMNRPGKDKGSAIQAAFAKESTEVIRLLVEFGAEIEAMGHLEGTALYYASEAGNVDAVTLLLQLGADVNARKSDGATALHIATVLQHEPAARALIGSEADVHLVGRLPSSLPGSNYRWLSPVGPLYLASMTGQLELSKTILYKGLNKFVEDHSLVEAINIAICKDNNCELPLTLIKIGLNAGMNINHFKENMLQACNGGNFELVKFFLGASIDPNIVGKLERLLITLRGPLTLWNARTMRFLASYNIDKSPLHASTCLGHSEIVRVLIDAGADVNALSSTGTSPLETAIYGTKFDSDIKSVKLTGGKLDTVKLLIEAGADIVHLKEDSLSLLWESIVEHNELALFESLAVRTSTMSLPSVPQFQDLVAMAVEHNQKDMLLCVLDFQPLIGLERAVLQANLILATEKGGHEILAILVDRFQGANEMVQDPESDLLLRAAKAGHRDVVDYLLRTTRCTTQDNLSQALKTSTDRDTIGCILQHINETATNNGCKPSIDVRAVLGSHLGPAVCRRGCYDLLESLLQWGADVNFQDEDGESALSLATRASAGRVDLHTETDRHNTKALSLLLQHGADPNIRGTTLGTPLIIAASTGAIEKVRLLLEAGADPNVQIEKHGSALIVAAACMSPELLKTYVRDNKHYEKEAMEVAMERPRGAILALLLQYGAHVNTEPEDLGVWGSALQAAACHGCVESAELLLDHGANINAKGGVLGTPIAAAARRGGPKIVQMLINRGANVNETGGYYGNALMAAMCRRHISDLDFVVRILRAAGAKTEEKWGDPRRIEPELPHYGVNWAYKGIHMDRIRS